METKDWRQEQERLEWVRNKLQARIAELEPEVAGLRDQAADIRKRFWEDLSINTSTTEDFEDTFYSVQQQSAMLAERERSHQRMVQQWNGMKRLLPSPYFGRVDFQEEGLNASEKVYVGVASFVDNDGLDFLIYDWRSPIASLYYDYPPGPASYLTPTGRIEGTMKLKRQFQIQNGQIRTMFDASETIGDELLQQVLSKDADSQMKSIVATIQKEQNAIIRNDKSRMLIVQGAAGSGKTSAALQRVAYLLYKHRQTIRADQIVLFSPNSMFGSYISTVLPELGEENMQQTIFQEYLEYWLGSSLRSEDSFDQIEYTLTAQGEPGYEARLQGIAYKTSEAFLKALQNYGQWLGREGMLFKDICFRDRVLITAERMSAKLYEFDSSLPLFSRVVLLQEWLMNELAALERKEREASWVQEELNYLDNDQYAEFFDMLHKERELFDLSEHYAVVQELMSNKPRGDEGDVDFALREEELILRSIVKKSFKPLTRIVKKFAFIDITGIYGQLFGDESSYREKTNEAAVPSYWPEICRQTKEMLGRSELFYEDATPYLFVKELVEGVRTNTEIRHVFVDEGQDYSAFQYEYIKKLFPRARMTVLGDFGQAIFMQSTNLEASDSPLIRLFGEADTSLIRLVRSYRSTREIVEFTKSLLPGGEEIEPFDRRGDKPLLISASGVKKRNARIVEDIASLRAEGLTSIAIITKTAAESREAYESLHAQGVEGVQLITKETLVFEKGVMIIPVYLAKGIEFEAVFIYNASPEAHSRDNERKLLYTACTRAMHRLHLYTAGDWSPFVQALPASLYELR
ncbi:DNA helicase-2 / ATP-dependent DNA helicase PcrA [Paenibacillus sp. UNCCL117]|uniref:RNA polymerase recycling motor HelD n=1 Tax=unclassified Paenibacillus TaxID=185978 RepID=UPI00088038F4|nr:MULTISPECIES: RNA polymerase recycling motor HelD [unclassified Paenibacillus]SDC12391.1 DNA helicase-2 / ATP-dependent DNA helicase PcrA [Paenibacillus sp. cl123]SFW16808.1 DNA helicase-2 / ATP-dependent DNA helicase PcrA [Paenibacillus sp. UNCCL117]